MVRRLTSVALACLGLGLAASVVYALAAGESSPGYGLRIAPAKQSALPGQAIRFSVGVQRRGGFGGPVQLDVTGLPRGVRATFRPNDDRVERALPLRLTGGTLTLTTSKRTPAGFRWVRLRSRGAGTTRSDRVGLRVIGPKQSRYRLAVTPGRQTVTAGDAVSLRVRVKRARGFRGRVRTRLAAVPVDWPRSSNGEIFRLTIPADEPSGAVRVVVAARSGPRRRVVRRYGVAVIQVARRRGFDISGDLDTPLTPGRRVPLDLVLDNPNEFDIRLTRLRVELGAGTSIPACGAAENYAVDQFSGTYPVLLAPGPNRLSTLVRDRSALPQVRMLDLPTVQNACRGARLALRYDGSAGQ